MKKIIFAVIVILVLGYVVYVNQHKSAVAPAPDNGSATGTVPAGGDAKSMCTNVGGNWDATYNECLGLAQNSCQEIGGEFNECASACRHDPTAEMCTEQCVQVCTLK